MAAGDKKPVIVIKKITVVQGGGHGGAWKVAFADFMTAMMTFFLVMWLVNSSSEATRKNISDYFSTPSVIEYNFSNYGVELTLEKLFLDLINEPLKTLSSAMEPMDKTPNMMQMGMKKVVMAYLADQLGDVAEDVEVASDMVKFEIPDTYLFERGKAVPSGQFVSIMEKIKGVVAGLEDSELVVTSIVYNEAVSGRDPATAKLIAQERSDLLNRKIETSFESESVELVSKYGNKRDERGAGSNKAVSGFVRFEVKQKAQGASGSSGSGASGTGTGSGSGSGSNEKKQRPLSDNPFGGKTADKSTYEQFVKSVSNKKPKQNAQ